MTIPTNEDIRKMMTAAEGLDTAISRLSILKRQLIEQCWALKSMGMLEEAENIKAHTDDMNDLRLRIERLAAVEEHDSQ